MLTTGIVEHPLVFILDAARVEVPADLVIGVKPRENVIKERLGRVVVLRQSLPGQRVELGRLKDVEVGL